jgi:hypothetical protein
MSDLNNKTNNELALMKKQLELDHEALKQKMLKDLDKLLEIERTHSEIIKLQTSRLSGQVK